MFGLTSPERRLKALERAVRELVEELQYQQKQIQRLRGHVTGGYREVPEEVEEDL